jgi:uncharacterized protein (TIGR03437 family)
MITSFTPTSGKTGTSVTISGTNLAGATAVAFNGTSASLYAVLSPTQIVASVPSGATTGKISVRTSNGTGLSTTNFTVKAGTQAPTVNSVSPTAGPVGTLVTITGTDLAGATSIAFGGFVVTSGWTVLSATQLQIAVPAGALTGKVAVTTPGGSASKPTFTVLGPWDLTVVPGGAGSGYVWGGDMQINCIWDGGAASDACTSSYTNGTSVYLTATPFANSQFLAWSGCDSVSGNTCTVTLSSARTVTAIFAPTNWILSVGLAGAGTGWVVSLEGQIACGGSCTGQYVDAYSVTLTALPGADSVFTGWTGCDSTSGTSCTVLMTSDRTVTATFMKKAVLAYIGTTQIVRSASITLTATLKTSSGTNISRQAVTFTINGSTYNGVWRSATGAYSVTISAPSAAGSYDLVVSYAGNGTYVGTSVTVPIAVS